MFGRITFAFGMITVILGKVAEARKKTSPGGEEVTPEEIVDILDAVMLYAADNLQRVL